MTADTHDVHVRIMSGLFLLEKASAKRVKEGVRDLNSLGNDSRILYPVLVSGDRPGPC
jgi:hypothetical protein